MIAPLIGHLLSVINEIEISCFNSDKNLISRIRSACT